MTRTHDAPIILMAPRTARRCAARLDALLGAGRWSHVDSDVATAAEATFAYFSNDVYRDPDGTLTTDQTRAFFAAVERASRLQWLQLFSAGADRPVHGRLRDKGVAVLTASGATAPFVALTAVTGMLMLARGFPRWADAQARREWLPADASPPRDLRGATALVIGTGPIGREIARLCQAVGLRAIGLRRRSGNVAPFDETHGYEALHAVAPTADVVVVACPLSDETRGLVDARFWAVARRGLLFVNVGRGEVADEAALIDALASGTAAGAYLDVFAKEPLPADSALWSLPNVLISPHAAAASEAAEREVDEIFFRNVDLWRRGALDLGMPGPVRTNT